VVCWHWGPQQCQRKGIQPDELIYDEDTHAPWCPECWPIREQFYKKKELAKLLGEKAIEN
jgi:hypothetical protein